MSEALSNKDWADILVQALPYFKQFVGKTIVVKYGGNAMLNDDLKQAVMEDIVLLSTIGIRTVLVHGGGPEINAMLDKVGKESKFIGGLRYTDAETMEIVQMVLTGKLNKDIVGLLLQAGGKAVGLSGVDSGLLRAKKIDKDGV
ncbi:MAG: acetylglutamate kinase, partial [Treponema sp.]